VLGRGRLKEVTLKLAYTPVRDLDDQRRAFRKLAEVPYER
jgi:hypothetical protein